MNPISALLIIFFAGLFVVGIAFMMQETMDPIHRFIISSLGAGILIIIAFMVGIGGDNK